MEDERTLIDRLRSRDEAAFTELVDRYYGHLLPLADFFVSNRAVAEEVVQEAASPPDRVCCANRVTLPS